MYGYNAESYNPNMDAQYLRARYYRPGTVDFLTEDSYLGNLRDSLTLNRYSYVKSSPLNYVDPSGHMPVALLRGISMLYDHDLLQASEVSILTMILNGLGFFTAMHELAQLNVAKQLFPGHFTNLEEKIYSATEKTWWGGCKSYEVDLVANATYAWEVKSVGQSVKDAKGQLNILHVDKIYS